MDAVERRLVRSDDGLIRLFDPPFDKSALNPGYIKGYLPGVRENGGQYTHAAVWAVMAFARLGDSRRAWELLALINPVRHGATAEGISDLPGRALRRRRRCLCDRTEHRAGRLDLVYRFRRLDVPSHRRVAPGRAA